MVETLSEELIGVHTHPFTHTHPHPPHTNQPVGLEMTRLVRLSQNKGLLLEEWQLAAATYKDLIHVVFLFQNVEIDSFHKTLLRPVPFPGGKYFLWPTPLNLVTMSRN